ncbi:cytochrome P450 monooxygenase [Colletotrichum graminicola]|uniref:Cytochrome P450 monooxygenase n=1 Tax=Colletotrichum graminicola (strain M1.001 / M2 / FGSC 10212) TaxID=645133 RepID=E3QWI4_COLGM|nr:cytochrome P450 monooxygenase [Colletotrichum graminicola M1.001]EFQ35222.1 cytochrome P450 monooxygenase [Colletotrichum graminicola M1.001]WDK09971.1 cytochrome P450 monooxygenase [Colletotrichum graminicola]
MIVFKSSSIPTSTILAFAGVAFLYLLYLRLLPKPLPGIPHNKSATESLMGDVASFIASQKQGVSMSGWIASQCDGLKSPIFQLLMGPLSKPIVVITDFREAEDISMRRTKHFDRGNSLGRIFGHLFPQWHLLMKTSNPLFKKQRKWLQDLMTPTFLHNVAAEPIYQSMLKVVELWEHKHRLARDRPFSAFEDIYAGALDAVLAFSFGGSFGHRSIPARIDLVSSSTEVPPSSGSNDPVVFREGKINEVAQAILDLAETAEETSRSVMPKLRSWSLLQTARIKKAKMIRDDVITREINNSVKKLQGEEPVSSAVDHMIYREKLFAEKEGREPEFDSIGMHSEIFGFLMAGHESSATTFAWGIKYMADKQHAQQVLREELRKHLVVATAENRQPTCEEIIKTSIPYLDATMEEILRCSGTTAGTERLAMQDTTILGHHIPKNTSVIMVTVGQSVTKPAFEIPESNRTKSALDATSRNRSWDSSTYPPAEFAPERWLVPGEGPNGMVFDPTAGPHMVFGLGPRACFGRRLAYLELRMFTALFFWNFELLQCPPELSSYESYDGLTVKPRQCYVRLRKML